MEKLIKYFINNSLVVNVLSVLILLAGSISLYGLQKEIFQKVEFDVIVVNTIYAGSSAEEVEKLVTIKIERSLKSVEGIKDLTGISTEGLSTIYVEIDANYEVENVLADVKDAIDSVNDFPDDVKNPKVKSLSNKARGTIKIAVTGHSYEEIRNTAKKLRDRLDQYGQISTVDLGGYRVDEVRVDVDVDTLNKFELTFSDVVNSIKKRNLNLSAGKIKEKNGDIIVRTISEFESIDDVKSVIIRSNTSGENIEVKDVANVTWKPSEAEVLERSQGDQAIFLSVSIKEHSDIISSTEEIKKITTDFFKANKADDTRYRFVDDMSYYVARRLNILKNNGAFGLIFVFFTLLFFLNFRASVVTSLGVPIAFMCAFICMDGMGVSLNMITMFALILVLGMIVDDAIIVSEYFFQKLEHGASPKDAALEAALKTRKPVFATIATTAVAFGSLYFMGGIMGKFVWPIPTIVIICLSASLFECFVILPSHLADFVRVKKDTGSRWYDPLRKIYEHILSNCLRLPFVVVFCFLVVFIISVYAATKMRFELFPGDDIRIVFIQLKGKVGASLEKTDEAVRIVENTVFKLVDSNTELDQVRATTGRFIGLHNIKYGAHYGSVAVYLTPPDERKRGTDEILTLLTNKLKESIDDYVITTEKVQGGPPKGKPIEIEFLGDRLEDILSVAKKALKIVESSNGVTSSEIDFEEGKRQIIVDINEVEAKRLGLSSLSIAAELRSALAGDTVTEIIRSDEDIDVNVIVNNSFRKKISTLSKLYVKNSQGRRILISKVASFKERFGALSIRRLNRKRVISVTGNIDNTETSPLKLMKELRPKIDDLVKKYKSTSYNFGGENEDTQESMGRLLKSGLIAVVCIFLILVVMFGTLGQPLIIMSTIPLGMIGVVFTFFILKMSLGFMALMGIVALMGVVVNDSIVLVTFINDKTEHTKFLLDAICKGCSSRFRPVLLTTLTTVAGLLPLAHFPGGDPFIKPMAISFAWGLMFASLVTLIFVPCMYLIHARLITWIKCCIEKVNCLKNNGL